MMRSHDQAFMLSLIHSEQRTILGELGDCGKGDHKGRSYNSREPLDSALDLFSSPAAPLPKSSAKLA